MGASRGIGGAIALRMSREGAALVVSGRRPAAIERVAGRDVNALKGALLLVELVATVQGLNLRDRNARHVSGRNVGTWALARGLHGLDSLLKIESDRPGRR